MKIAFTADLHLKSSGEAPERFRALENILSVLKKEKISNLVIAGDLFDSRHSGFSDTERICSSEKNITFHIIPGNHDTFITEGKIVADNIEVFSRPAVKNFDGVELAFIPYNPKKAMSESLEEVRPRMDSKKPLYITGHGDWMGGAFEPNPLEKGVYMPLTEADLKRFSPVKVILGHIHKPSEYGRVFYPGSPSPLHINETGRRSFIVVDTEQGSISRFPVDSELLYFSGEIFILPLEDEAEEIERLAVALQKEWALSEEDKKKSLIRVKVKGYTSNREKAAGILKEKFNGYRFYDESGSPDISSLLPVSSEPERLEIARRCIEYIEKRVEWDFTEPDSPTREEVIIRALAPVFK